jgi:integrase
MPRDLTAREIAGLAPRQAPYRIARNLYLSYDAPARRSWLLRYVSPTTGKPTTMGLGPAEHVSVPEAKAIADKHREAIFRGRDPLAERRGQEPARGVTFRECADRYFQAHRDAWRSKIHCDAWAQSLRDYALPVLGDLPVQLIDTGHVMRVLEPHWRTRTATIARVRGRIETVLDYAAARHWRTGENPARWRGHIDQLVPAPKKQAPVRHLAALDWREMPGFWADLAKRGGVGAQALRWIVLTASRRGEAIGAVWDEVDTGNRLWTLPATRVKAFREHRVPLADAALEILAALPRLGDHLFPGTVAGRPVGPSTVLEMLRDLRPGVTIHGFRSSFRDWATETGVPREVAEAALAHREPDPTVRAYARSDLLELRCEVMVRWATFLAGSAP